MPITFNISATSVRDLLNDYDYLIRYAASSALNDTANSARVALNDQTKRVFDRPNRRTTNAGEIFFRATPKRLQAMVGLKDDPDKGIPQAVYLKPQVYGGGRDHKRFEKALLNKIKGFGRGTYFVPAVQNTEFFDRYGNLKRGTITQMLSHLQAFGAAGYQGNIKNPNRALYFPVIRRGDYGMLHPGIYKRDSIGSDNFKAVVYAIPREPQYRKRFYYFETVEKSLRKNFPVRFVQRFKAMANKRSQKFTAEGAKIAARTQNMRQMNTLLSSPGSFASGASQVLR